MMKTFKTHKMLVLLLSIFFVFNSVEGQIEDELLGEQTLEEDNNCIPEDLSVTFDRFADKELSSDIRIIYSYGYEYYKNKSYDEALPYLWQVFVKDKDKLGRSAIRKITEIYFYQEKFDSTLISCYRGLADFPDLGLLHHYAGLLQNMLGKFRCALPHFEQLVEDNPEEPSYLQTLASLYYRDDNSMAIEIQQRLVDLDPNNAEASQTLAQYKEYFEGAGAGLEAYKQAYESDPSNLSTALRYGRAAAQSGKYQEALIPLTRVVESNAEPNVLKIRAEVYENLNQFSNAIEDYKSVLNTTPGDAEVMVKIAVNYQLQYKFSSAKYWIDRALSTKPGFGLAYITMGEIYESAVEYCQNQRGGEFEYEDKLVYKKAYDEYIKAQRDPIFRAKARNRQASVMPLIPTPEDEFMHKNDKISSDCYDWLK